MLFSLSRDSKGSPICHSQNPAELSAIISSFIGVIYADVHGNVHILDATIQSIRTWVAHVGGRVTHLAENRGILVTLGVGNLSAILPMDNANNVSASFRKKTVLDSHY